MTEASDIDVEGSPEVGASSEAATLFEASQTKVVKRRLHKQAKSLSRRLGRMIQAERIDEDDVKAARVGIRRLRATILLSDHVLPGHMQKELKRALRTVARQFGPIRDLDVLRLRIVETTELWDMYDDDAAASLLRSIDREREIAVTWLSKDRSRHLQEELRHLLSSMRAYLNSDDSSDRVLPIEKQQRQLQKRCEKSFRRLDRFATQTKKKCSDEELHALRVLVKQTRYLMLFAGEIAEIGEAKPVADLLADLQTRLGNHQDAVVAIAWLRVFVLKSVQPRELALARQLILEQRRVAAEVREQWRDVWRGIKKSPAAKWLKN